MIYNEIKKWIEKEIPRGSKFSISHPPQKEYGDYSIILNPKIAEKIISKKLPAFAEKLEFKKPVFLNIFIKKKILQRQVAQILKQGEKFANVNLGRNKKTNIEFISANPTGILHIGNGRGVFFGDALANVLEKAGFKVAREYYVNDAKISNQIHELGKTALGNGEVYLSEELKILIKKLEPKIKEFKGNESEAGFFLAENIQENNKKFIEDKLKIKFDKWVSENDLYRSGKVKKVFSFFDKNNFIYRKDGAVWLKTKKYGCEKDNVLLRKNGQATYFLSDIAYHKDKIDRDFKKIIDVWGADHHGHIKRMKVAMEAFGRDIDFDVLIAQIARLKSGKKLSRRKGEIIALEELVDEVGLDVVRYFYLSKSMSSQMEFDLSLAKEKSEKNPVYYIQYAHTRICGIERNLKFQKVNLKMTIQNLKLLDHESELSLIKELIKFPEIIETTAKDYQVQRIPEYGRNLASVFNQFYRDCSIARRGAKSADSLDLSYARFGLAMATKIVLKNTLALMGIFAPEKM